MRRLSGGPLLFLTLLLLSSCCHTLASQSTRRSLLSTAFRIIEKRVKPHVRGRAVQSSSEDEFLSEQKAVDVLALASSAPATPSQSSNSKTASNQTPSGPLTVGQTRFQQLLKFLNGVSGTSPYSNFIQVLTDSGCRGRLETILDVYRVTLFLPNNQAVTNTTLENVSKQRTCFHILLGKWPAAALRQFPKRSKILTSDVWPQTRVWMYKLDRVGNQFEGSPSRKVGGKLVAPDLYTTPFLTVHGTDVYMKPNRYFKGYG